MNKVNLANLFEIAVKAKQHGEFGFPIMHLMFAYLLEEVACVREHGIGHQYDPGNIADFQVFYETKDMSGKFPGEAEYDLVTIAAIDAQGCNLHSLSLPIPLLSATGVAIAMKRCGIVKREPRIGNKLTKTSLPLPDELREDIKNQFVKEGFGFTQFLWRYLDCSVVRGIHEFFFLPY